MRVVERRSYGVFSVIAVFAAMRLEFCGFPRELGMSRSKDGVPQVLFEGKCGASELIAVKAGIGPVAAQRAAERVLQVHAPLLVVSVGLAGAVDNKLSVGDIVICSQLYREGFPTLSSDSRFVRIAAAGNHDRLCTGATLTVDAPVATPGAKRRVAESWPVAIVEMESYSVAQEAAAAKRSFIAIRVISDTSDESVPDFMHLRKILANPVAWWSAGRSAHHAIRAIRSLEKFLLPFLRNAAADLNR